MGGYLLQALPCERLYPGLIIVLDRPYLPRMNCHNVYVQPAGDLEYLQKEVNRQLWGCGYGVLARWVTGATTAITVQKSYRGNSVGGDGFGSTFGAKYLEENDQCVVVVLSSASSSSGVGYTVDATSLTVSAIVKGTGSTLTDAFTVTNAAVSEAGGSFYVRIASLGTIAALGTQRLEMMGLRGIVDNDKLDNIVGFDGSNSGPASGTDNYGLSTDDYLQGLNTGTYPFFKANVFTHASGRYYGQRAITDDLLQQSFDAVEKKAGKGYGPSMMITSRPIRRTILALWKTDRRFVNTMEFDGGWSGLEYNGIGIFVDNDAIDGELYVLTTKDLQIYRMSDYDWMDRDGAILFRISGKDAYEATLFRYAEMGCTRRNSQAVIADLSYERDET